MVVVKPMKFTRRTSLILSFVILVSLSKFAFYAVVGGDGFKQFRHRIPNAALANLQATIIDSMAIPIKTITIDRIIGTISFMKLIKKCKRNLFCLSIQKRFL